MVLFFMQKNMITLCLYYFFVGCTAYALYKNLISLIGRLKMIFLSMIGIGTGIFLVSLDGVPKMISFGLLFPSFIVLLVGLESYGYFPKSKLLEWIGHTSYGNYLWHSPLQMAFFILCSLGLIDIAIVKEFYFVPIYLISVILVSIASFYLFENPMKKSLNRYLLKKH